MENIDLSVLLKSLEVIIPVVSVFVSYFLGRSQSNLTYKREQAQYRYSTFYVPFFTRLYAGRLWELPPASMNFEVRSIFLDLFTSNLSLLGPNLQSLYADLHRAHCNLLWFEDGDPGFDSAPSEYNRVFMQIIEAAIAESKPLCKFLRLPPIAKSFETCLRNARES